MMRDDNKYRISGWFAEFSDRELERSFQNHTQSTMTRQLRIALLVWITLLLVFAVPDYIGMGPTAEFYHLLAYRIVMAAALMILLFSITPNTNIFRASYPLMAIAIVYMTGFMLFFVYLPDALYLIIGVILIQVIAFPLFIPVRFVIAAAVTVYSIAVTLLTRYLLGARVENLVALFVIMLLPAVIGVATANRLGRLSRRQYALLVRTEEMNRELQQALRDKKELSGMLPICASCKKIRNDKGYWEQIENYIRDHSEAEFSHGICPECMDLLYPGYTKKSDPGFWTEHCRIAGMVIERMKEIEKSKKEPSLINGHDLLDNFKLTPGPVIKAVLETVAEAQAIGEIATRDQALDFARNIIEKRDLPAVNNKDYRQGKGILKP